MPLEEFNDLINQLNLNKVPFIDYNFTLPWDISTLVEYANGDSLVQPKTKRKGVVIKNNDMSISFKVIIANNLLSQ